MPVYTAYTQKQYTLTEPSRTTIFRWGKKIINYPRQVGMYLLVSKRDIQTILC